MILYLTGLNNVAPDQIEAARLDGAKGWRMLWYVIMPQLRPATFIAVVVTVIGALRSFDLVSIMTVGGPYGSTRVLSYYMYEKALSEYGFRMGYGAAIAVVLFAIMMVFITGFIWKMWRRKGAADVPDAHPEPAPGSSAATRSLLPIALVIWLLPLLGVALTSIRPASDLAPGNYFGMPSSFAGIENYSPCSRTAHRPVHPQLLQGDDPHGDRRGGAVLPDRLCAGGLQVPGATCSCSSCSSRAISCRSRS